MATGSDVDKACRSLEELVKQLDPKMRKRAMRNTLAKEAKQLANIANRHMAAQSFHNAAKVAKAPAFKGIVWKKKLEGFSVKTRANGANWMYRNKRGELLPIPYWAELGTGEYGPEKTVRRTKPGFYHKGEYWDMKDHNKKVDRRAAPSRGSTEPVGALEKAESAIPETERRIIETFRQKVEQQIEKYGK